MLRAVAGIALGPDLDASLQHLVDAVAELAGCRVAALGIAGPDGGFERFVAHGMHPVVALRLGVAPQWERTLGTVLAATRPVRLSGASRHSADPARPSASFLGVSVAVQDRVLGALCLVGKQEAAEFGEPDEELAVAVAGAAGIALENARLHDQARRRSAWLVAATRTSRALSAAGAADADEGLWSAVRAAREASGADVASLVSRRRGLSDGSPPAAVRAALELSVPTVVEDDALALALGWRQVRRTLALPVRPDVDETDVLVLGWQRPVRLEPTDLAMANGFCEQVALALDVARAADDGRRLAVYRDRDRIARDLHDLVIQRLFAIGLSLQSVGRRLPPGGAQERLEAAVDELDVTIREVRRTIYHLHVRDIDRGLRPAVERVVDEAAEALGFAPTLQLEGRCEALPGDVVADVVAVLHEALTNVARHAGAHSVEVQVSVAEEVVVSVADDGRGRQREPQPHHRGLANLAQRAVDRGGALSVDPGSAGGTHLRWRAPLP